MNGLPIELETLVAENGYKVVDAREAVESGEPKYGEGKRRMITDSLSDSVSRLLSRAVRPLQEDSAIHRNFASLDLTEESFLDFAGRYGLLTGGIEVPIEIQSKVEGKSVISVGEPVTAWKSEVEALREAIHLWELVQGNEEQGLRRYFEDEKPELPPKFSALVTIGQLTKPAIYILKGIIRSHIRGMIVLDVTEDDDLEGPLNILSTLSLRMGLWGMLSSEIHDRRQYKSCTYCGKWFEILPGERRTTRRYCSDACRIKTYRERQEEARRMYADGTSVKAIAKKLDTDAATAEKWIEAGGEKKK